MSRCVDVRRARPLLGTIVDIAAGGRSRRRVVAVVDGAFAAVERVQRLMSFHEPDSDVSRLNRAAHHRPIAVHPWTYRVLRAARRLSAQTGGLFDCTVAPTLVRWGYLPAPATSRLRHLVGDWRDIQLLTSHRVRFRRPVWIDLGGIAKGFAVDQAVEALRRGGAAWGCVNAGGDLRCFGRRRQTVYVRHPAQPNRLQAMGDIRDTALATSATYFSRQRVGRRWRTPIVRPSTQRPCTSAISVSVFAPSCLVADGLTKPVLLSDHADDIVRRFNALAVIVAPAAA